MNDLEMLFVVLVVLYAWECTCWLRRGGVAFTTWLGRNWQAQHPGALIANQAGGFILAAPLPPLGTLLVAHQFPLSISATGVLGFVATNVNPGWRPTQTGRFVLFADIRETKVRGRKLLVNGELLALCATPGLARHCAGLLQLLTKLKPQQREAALAGHQRQTFDAPAVTNRREQFQKHQRLLRILCNALLAYVFILLPAVIWQVGLKSSWLSLLIGLLGLTTATSYYFRRAHLVLYPKAEDERFTHTFTILLAPCTAMRAHDALSRPLLEEFHPLAVAKVFLSETDFREFAGRVWRDLHHPALPVCPNENPDARATEQQARDTTRSIVASFLKRTKINPEELDHPPKPADDSCRAYCPRCHAQFTSTDTTCADCGGLTLMEFKPPDRKPRPT